MSDPSKSEDVRNYTIDLHNYAKALKSKWPKAQIVYPDSLTYVIQWELNTDETLGVFGGLQSDKQTVSFGSNPKENAIEFILWYRSFIPSSQYLLLFDDNMDLKYELKPDVGLENLKGII